MTRAFDPTLHHPGCVAPPGNEKIPLDTAPMLPLYQDGTGTGSPHNMAEPPPPVNEAQPPMPMVPLPADVQKVGCGPTFLAEAQENVAAGTKGSFKKATIDGATYGDTFQATNISQLDISAGDKVIGGYDASCAPFCSP